MIQDSENDLKAIRAMMERSTKFISLSGLAGVGVGLTACISAYLGYKILEKDGHYAPNLWDFQANLTQLFLLGIVTVFISIGIAIYFSRQKAKQQGVNIWNKSSKNLVKAMVLPLAVGCLFSLGAIYQQIFWMVFPALLLFYGLALVAASNYTERDVYYLGLCEIALGLISLFYQKYNLLFWVAGFGLLHVFYGLLMHFKYDKK